MSHNSPRLRKRMGRLGMCKTRGLTCTLADAYQAQDSTSNSRCTTQASWTRCVLRRAEQRLVADCSACTSPKCAVFSSALVYTSFTQVLLLQIKRGSRGPVPGGSSAYGGADTVQPVNQTAPGASGSSGVCSKVAVDMVL